MSCQCPSQNMPEFNRNVAVDIAGKTAKHPCYSADAHLKFARMHLPVAPACNISCNYCNRKFDCVNESRPGVTSELLTPEQALTKFGVVKDAIPNLSVIGIAGPGDALANWEETKKAISLIKAADPDMVFCLSTNGLMLPKYAPEIVGLGVHHVTVTVNCLDPKIGAQLYRHVIYEGKTYVGEEGAALLLQNQLAGIQYLTSQGVLVKVNIVMVKGVNDEHIPDVVRKVKELGAFMTNIMPLIPAPGSVFENHAQTSRKELDAMRNVCQVDLHQMRHCQQCRADAIGMLHDDRSQEFRTTKKEEAPLTCDSADQSNYKIAVTSKAGKVVDLHFGHAAEFHIFSGNCQGFQFVEKRSAQKYCTGTTDCDDREQEKEAVVETIADCDAVLTMRIGYHARERLLEQGILSVESCNTVEEGLVYAIAQLQEQKAI